MIKLTKRTSSLATVSCSAITFSCVLFLTLNCSKTVRYDPIEPIITIDYDTEPIPEPAETEVSDGYDFIDKTIFQQIKGWLKAPFTRKGRGWNVNALGDVPKSSWFTNRIEAIQMTPAEVARGPNTIDGVADGEWLILRGKTEGTAPGFHIKDRNGNRFVIKFDPKHNPEMLSGAEVISTRFLHAIGYNVPENYIAFFRFEQLRIKEDAKLRDAYGIPRSITLDQLQEKLRSVAHHPDGSYRVLASRYIEGKLLKSFSYSGTRKDDSNDIIPHEHRRDLRGLGVFMAFLNNTDARGPNSMDSYVNNENGNGHVKHYLLDFGQTLGSKSRSPKTPPSGNEYRLDGVEIMKNFVTLGLHDPNWKDSASPEFEFTEIGLFESEHFEPQKWKPSYPNLAFQQMDNLDAYWAARILMSFTDAHIRAIVETAQYTDPAATQYTAKTLIERRDKIGRYYFSKVNPVDRFELITGQDGFEDLRFQDLAVEYRFASKEDSRYLCTLYHLADNGRRELGSEQVDDNQPFKMSRYLTQGIIANSDHHGKYLMVSIRTKRGDDVNLSKNVDVHLYSNNGLKNLRVIGIDREG